MSFGFDPTNMGDVLLEHFDFDALLQSTDEGFNFEIPVEAAALEARLDNLHTISEDLAEGKLTHKEKALKLLGKKVQFSGFGSEKVNEERSIGVVKGDYAPAISPVPPRALETSRSQFYRPNILFGADMATAPASSAGPYNHLSESAIGTSLDSSLQDRLPDSLDDEENYIEDLDDEKLDRDGDEEDPSDGHDDGTSTPQSYQDSSVERDMASAKRKALSTYNNAEHRFKRNKLDPQLPHPSPEVSHDDEYSELVKSIYMIHCPNPQANYHEAMAYEDRPFFTRCAQSSTTSRGRQKRSKLAHANGTEPIHDLVSYLKDDDDDTAIIVVRLIRCEENQGFPHAQGQPLKWHESLAIKSSTLRQSIADIAQCYYNKNDVLPVGRNGVDNQMNRLTISPARLFFFHHLPRLIDYVETHPLARDHVSALNEYCRKYYVSDFQRARQLFAQGLVSQKHLDKLYLPNTIVISHENGLKRGFVVSKWPVYDDATGGLQLECWAWQNNGTGWCRSSHRLTVPPISSSQVPVRSLDVYPADLGCVETMQMLAERGRKLWDLKDSSYVSYTGHDVQGEDYYPESRFMIDYAVYKKMHEHASALDVNHPNVHVYDPWPSRLDPKRIPCNQELMVMPHVVHGFYLIEKQWVCILVDGVHDIKWNKTAYDRLVIPSQTKELIRALVTVRTSQRGIKHGLGVAGKRVDIIAGKGNGLIMLLHGGPGTGKSLTAESMAEIAEMPLYRVTCGDIGNTPEAVEKYMGVVMHLGVTWNCVLLLDEADVFLEERSMSDLARNSLVSVFLRILEYYDGILILTSNRIGIFDEAFKSRIQVALHYEKLTISSRKKIWTNFIDMLEEDEEDVNFEEIRYKLDQLAKIDLNGRQIRNILTTARQLAIFQARRLDWPHIEQALSVTIEFNDYIQRMQGHTDDQRARDEKLR